MHEHIRRWEHRAEQLALRVEELADQPDVARVVLFGVLAAAALCWFAVAWGEGLLLLALPLVAVGCVKLSKARGLTHDPSLEEHDADLGSTRAEIDQWLTRLAASAPRTEPDLSRPVFQAAAPALDLRVAAPPSALPPAHEPLVHLPEPVAEPAPSLLESSEPEDVTATTIYEIAELHGSARVLLEVRSTFDSAADVAFELIAERDPPQLEIDRVCGAERVTEWRYDREAASSAPRGTLDLFGFDATRWTGVRR